MSQTGPGRRGLTRGEGTGDLVESGTSMGPSKGFLDAHL